MFPFRFLFTILFFSSSFAAVRMQSDDFASLLTVVQRLGCQSPLSSCDSVFANLDDETPCPEVVEQHFFSPLVCDSVGRVIKLYFAPGTEFHSGFLHPHVGNLVQLQSLYWHGTSANGKLQFTGRLPTEIGYLTLLTSLTWRNGTMAGTIPTTLGALTNLNQLDLSYNLLSGSLPTEFNQFTSLVRLELNSNYFSGTLPQLGSVSSLSHLDLGNNGFSDGLFRLPTGNSFVFLSFYRNNFFGAMPAFNTNTCYTCYCSGSVCDQHSNPTNNENMLDTCSSSTCCNGCGMLMLTPFPPTPKPASLTLAPTPKPTAVTSIPTPKPTPTPFTPQPTPPPTPQPIPPTSEPTPQPIPPTSEPTPMPSLTTDSAATTSTALRSTTTAAGVQVPVTSSSSSMWTLLSSVVATTFSTSIPSSSTGFSNAISSSVSTTSSSTTTSSSRFLSTASSTTYSIEEKVTNLGMNSSSLPFDHFWIIIGCLIGFVALLMILLFAFFLFRKKKVLDNHSSDEEFSSTNLSVRSSNQSNEYQSVVPVSNAYGESSFSNIE